MTRLATYRGDNESFTITVRDAAGALVNLTGATLRFTAKYRASDLDAAAIFSKTTGAGITHAADQAGVGKGLATVALVPGDTTTLPAPLVVVWDCQLRDAAANVQTVATGSLRIRADISRTAP
jgi:hypothetical protein